MKIATMLANGFEEVEALAVVDILRRVNVEVDMISINEDENVVGAHNIGVVADKVLKNVELSQYDSIFLPGGMPGTNNLDACEVLCENIVKFNDEGKMLAAICAAPKVFGRLGVLEGRDATCFPGFEEELKGANVLNEKVVVSENVVTSKGMGTAVLLGLKLVEIICGKDFSEKLEKTIQM